MYFLLVSLHTLFSLSHTHTYIHYFTLMLKTYENKNKVENSKINSVIMDLFKKKKNVKKSNGRTWINNNNNDTQVAGR